MHFEHCSRSRGQIVMLQETIEAQAQSPTDLRLASACLHVDWSGDLVLRGPGFLSFASALRQPVLAR